jgi:hypothetical protein
VTATLRRRGLAGTVRRLTLATTVALVAVAPAACLHKPRFMQPAAQREWPGAYIAAQAAADRGAYGDADKMLADFAASHANTPEALECGYWRAVYRLDPSNKDASTRDAIAGLDKYLTAPNGTHRGEATTLRHIAAQLLALDKALNQKADDSATTARDEEVKKLREELESTKDELERIKRRLAAPKTP